MSLPSSLNWEPGPVSVGFRNGMFVLIPCRRCNDHVQHLLPIVTFFPLPDHVSFHCISGKVELKNLSVKENALDSLDLPFRVIHGRVGMLSASIPWASIYTSPVVLKMSNILLVAAPNVDSEYDEEKETKQAEAAKQKVLASIEDALRKAQEQSSASEKEKPDDFATKLSAQIIKNVQVRIDNVHVRYEDNFTDPLTPFVAGITLKQMRFETEVQQNSQKYATATSDDIIYKLVSLQNLSIYWNVIDLRNERQEFISHLTQPEEKDARLLQCIATDDAPVRNLDYLLKPITFTADAMINRKPHIDEFSVPVMDLDVSLNDFKLGFNSRQVETLVQLLDALSRMRLAHPHRRFRPTGAVHNNAKAWWYFAITSILQNDVQRKNRQWSWKHIQEHRNRLRRYLAAYKEKLLNPKNKAHEAAAAGLESELDVFNIVLVRRQAESEVASQLKALEQEKKDKKKKGGSWFGGWWGGSDEGETESGSVNVIEDLKKEMTAEEKEKLYAAIGYEPENADFPPEFEAHLLSLNLRSINFVITDEKKGGQIIDASLTNVVTNVRHRPASKGIEVAASVGDLVAFGVANRPLIREDYPEKAFVIQFISNPVSKEFDFGIVVKTNPLHLVHDAPTVNALLGIMSKPSDVSISQIQALADDRIRRLKKMSATGLEYAISKHPDVKIDIDLAPFFLILPGGDIWDESESSDALIACLGRVRLNSVRSDRKEQLEVRHMSQIETPESIIEKIRERAYESYQLSLTEIQIILSTSQTWKRDIGFDHGNEYRVSDESCLLKPVTLQVLLQRCLVSDDPDLPKFKVEAVLPKFLIIASDSQLIRTLTVLMEMPSPQMKDKFAEGYAADTISLSLDEPDISSDTFKNLRRGEAFDVTDSAVESADKQEVIDFSGQFTINEIICEFLSGTTPLMKIIVKEIGASATKDTFTLNAKAHLGQILVETKSSDNDVVYLLQTLMNEQLLCVEYTATDKKSPFFDDVSQKASIKVTDLSSTVDHSAIGNIMAWSENITKHLPQKKLAEVSAELRKSASSISSLGVMIKRKKMKIKKRQKKMQALVMLALIEAKFDIKRITLSIRNVCSMYLEGLKGSFTLFESSRTKVDLEWNGFLVQNEILDERSLTFRNIVSSDATTGVLQLSIVMFSPEELTSQLSDVDMKVSVVFGQLKVVFLNEFVMKLLQFLSKFEDAKKAAVEATYAAADYAKQTAISAYEKCTKLGLNVSLDAPQILIPRNWESASCLIVDLGKIVINNSFKTRQRAVIDFMQINLADAHISIQDDVFNQSAPGQQSNILSPISFTISVTRNLTFSSNKIFPELEVSAKLDQVYLALSQYDLQLFMHILAENLATSSSELSEPVVPASPEESVPLSPDVSPLSLSRIPELSRQTPMILEEAEIHVDAETVVEKVYTRLKFDFTLPDVGVWLYDGHAKTEDEKLCQAELINFQTFGEQSTDNSLGASVIIDNIRLSDVRSVAKDNAISTFLDTKKGEEAGADDDVKMLKILVTMRGSTDLLVDMQMRGITLIFALDYLLRVSAVFVEGISGGQKVEELPAVEAGNLMISPMDAVEAAAAAAAAGKTITPTKESMTIIFHFQMTKSDIVLIESVQSDDSPAVILNSLFELDIKQREDQLSLVGKVAQIQLAVTNLREYQRKGEVEAYVLKPCDLDFVGKLDGEANTKRLDVTMDSVQLNISPNTVQVLLSILSAIGSESQDSKGKQDEDERKQTSDLLSEKSLLDEETEFWFLKKEDFQAVEATEETDVGSPISLGSISSIESKDQLMIKISSAKIVVETGGMSSLPVLQLETSFTGRLDGWTKLSSSVALQMDYYNERVNAWEPVIEPIDGSNEKWCTEFSAKIVSDNGSSKVMANFESSERLELTISKTFLNLASRLGEAFGKAVKKSESLRKDSDIIRVTNMLGLDLMIVVDQEKYEFEAKNVTMKEGMATIILYPQETITLDRIRSLKSHEEEAGDFIARLVMDNKDMIRTIALTSRCKRVYDIPVISYPTSKIRWLLKVDMPDMGNKQVIFGTPVEIVNNLQRKIAVYTFAGDQTELLQQIGAGDSWYLPLTIVFSEHDLIFIGAAGDDYCIPNTGIPFKDPANANKQMIVKCQPKRDSVAPVNIQVVMAVYNALYEDTNRRIARCITLEVNPTLVIQNLLPVDITYGLHLCCSRSLSPGEKHQLGQFDPLMPEITIEIPDYGGHSWISRKKVDIVDFDDDDVIVWTFAHKDMASPDSPDRSKQLNIAMSLSKPFPAKPILAQIFSPFWLVNETGRKLSLKSGDTIYDLPPNANFPFLFSFRAGKLFKQKLQMQIDGSHFSDSFSIDAVGNRGDVICKERGNENMTFCISVDIALSSFSLTKIVTFTPFYSVINRTEFNVEISDNRNNWVPVTAASSISFWPEDSKKGHFYVRHNFQVSTPVSFRQSNSALVAIGNELFNVLVDVSDSEIKIQLSDYDDGSCPVRFFNHSDRVVSYWQQGSNQKKRLHPLHFVHAVWDEPSGDRVMVWQVDQETEESFEPVQDSFGSIMDGKLFWVSFLDGKQRTFLISPDYELTMSALQTAEFTKPKVTIETSFKGLGISVVNDDLLQDLIYMGISGSDTAWEVKKDKSKRYKPLQMRQTDLIESAYQRELVRRKYIGEEEGEAGRTAVGRPSIVALGTQLKVDFTDLENMRLLEPVKGSLRRYSAPAFWALVNLSDHVTQMHAKIGRIQIDNQTDNCLFNIIMCPVSPPKSLAMDRSPKSFIELSTVLQRTANLNRFKYLSVLIQEFLVQVDGAFLLTMSEFIGKSDETSEVSYEKLIATDIKSITEKQAITDDEEVVLSKYFFDLIHFSPIKVHVSFSLGGISSFQVLGVLDLLMRSAGVTLTEFKDVTFRIDFFERKNVLLDQQELISMATSHYVRQVLKQFYVIVLGLDVIGNPVGLFIGLKEGVGDFFYEPFLGIIEGPEEFAEGLALGVKSLFSHTVGGAADALSRITGTIGEGVSALTMDDEFIKKRRSRMQRKQTVAESGKELAHGFWRGLSGIIRKPIEGARDDGFEGFMKGIGKGAVGVIAQPATGVIDFASGSLGALKKAVDINAEAKRQRPARFFPRDSILRPYNLHEATGNQILQRVEKGVYANTDHYLSHCTIRHPANSSKEVIVLITDQRLLVLKESCMYSSWQVDWKEDFNDISSVGIDNASIVKFILKVQGPATN